MTNPCLTLDAGDRGSGYQASYPKDRVHSSVLLRANHQVPSSEDLEVPSKSRAKTVCTGSGLPAHVTDKAGLSTLAREAGSSLPQLAWGRPTEEQLVLAVPLLGNLISLPETQYCYTPSYGKSPSGTWMAHRDSLLGRGASSLPLLHAVPMHCAPIWFS